ncbi:hypothetical protein GUJ93_ZPchr0004g39009 [Zizania palustris]|nr:hypothetical protein GUJ93_ZPchr0004g39009 [Zizania palustris]
MIVPEKPPKRQHISLNLLPGNNSDKNEGTEKQVPVNNNKNDQDGISIGSTEMIVQEKPPKRQRILLNLLPGNDSGKNEGAEKQVPINNNNNDQDGVSIGSTEMIVQEKPPKRQQILLNLLPGNDSGKNEGAEKQLQAWSIEHKTRKEHAKDLTPLQDDQNDDTCRLCGDGGELICCDNCPASYHQDCLPCQDIPDGSWYCYGCLCDICGEVINLEELGSSLPALECSQCEQQYHVKCISGMFLCNEEGGPCAWFCGRRCQQIYMNLCSRVGMPDHINDGFSCTVLRNNGDQNISKDADIALLAECNMKLVIALRIMEECFLPIIDPRTGIDIMPSILYNWRSEFVHLDYKGFYTVVLENDDNIISVASIRLHGTLVAEMPLVATCRDDCQQGMCKRLMDYIEEMLKSLKVEMLLLSAIPNLVDTWTSTFGFELIDDRDKKKLSKLRLVSVPGTALLKRNLSDCSDTDAGQLPFPKP